ncbi:MAG: fibronectin type III domain-containing protein [Treponema sp.]|jgi:hypothetical protein|nr:fibronectin type III domain-containing protein [Treponema sp.]
MESKISKKFIGYLMGVLFLFSGCDLLETPAELEVAITVLSSTSIEITWNDVPGIAIYRVEKKVGSSWSNMGQPYSTTYTETGLTPNTTYQYRITAVFAGGGKNDISKTVSATTSFTDVPPDSPADPAEPTGPVVKYAPEYWGEWLRMDTGDAWYISSGAIKINNQSSSAPVSLSKQSDRVIEASEGSRKYHLYASRTANASFSGKIAAFETGHGRSVQRAVGNGLGGIGIVVSNLNNKANELTATTDGEGNFTVENAIPGDSYTIIVEEQTTTVTPSANGDDIGTITVTDGVNFKTSVKPASSSVDMQRLYANLNAYNFTITIQNTGTVDCTAATYALDFDDDLLVVSQPSSSVLGTIEPGKSKTIAISLGCKAIQSEYAFKKIGVRVTDTINQKTWEDSVSLKFNKAPVAFNIRANSNISGIVITPNAQAYSFSGTNTSLTLPWSTRDYLVVFSGATADTEAIYSLGVNVMADSSFNSFTDLGNYEGNDTENAATSIQMSDTIMSYLHKNDFDYYKINLGATAPEIKPVSITDFAYTDSNGNGDKSIQPSESGYLDIRVKNNTNSRQSISAALTSTNGYVTIDKGTAEIGDLSAGYYATLTYSASSSSSVTLLYSGGISKSFKFTISETCPVGTDISFTVTFTDSWGNTWTDSLTVPVVGTGASVGINTPTADNYKISEAANGNGDGKANPHETHYLDIRIKNGGTSKALGLQAALTSASGYVTIEQGAATIGDLSAGYYTTLTTYSASSTASYTDLLYSGYLSKAFKFTISDTCPVGTQLPFTVTFTDSWGNTWTDSLTAPVE